MLLLKTLKWSFRGAGWRPCALSVRSMALRMLGDPSSKLGGQPPRKSIHDALLRNICRKHYHQTGDSHGVVRSQGYQRAPISRRAGAAMNTTSELWQCSDQSLLQPMRKVATCTLGKCWLAANVTCNSYQFPWIGHYHQYHGQNLPRHLNRFCSLVPKPAKRPNHVEVTHTHFTKENCKIIGLCFLQPIHQTLAGAHSALQRTWTPVEQISKPRTQHLYWMKAKDKTLLQSLHDFMYCMLHQCEKQLYAAFLWADVAA